MAISTEAPSVRPPVAVGCLSMAAVVVALIAIAVFAVTYLESGSEDGKVRLELAASYGPGTFVSVPAHHLYLIRLADRRFVALADLDAANRAATGRRCRVTPLEPGPALTEAVAKHATRLSPQAAGVALFFQEACNGATYDAVGVRLDRDGRNLDRHPVEIDAKGRVVVDVAKRLCTAREGPETAVTVAC